MGIEGGRMTRVAALGWAAALLLIAVTAHQAELVSLSDETLDDVMMLDATPEQIAKTGLMTRAKNVAQAAFDTTSRVCPIAITGRTEAQTKTDITKAGAAIKTAMDAAYKMVVSAPKPSGNTTAPAKGTAKGSNSTVPAKGKAKGNATELVELEESVAAPAPAPAPAKAPAAAAPAPAAAAPAPAAEAPVPAPAAATQAASVVTGSLASHACEQFWKEVTATTKKLEGVAETSAEASLKTASEAASKGFVSLAAKMVAPGYSFGSKPATPAAKATAVSNKTAAANKTAAEEVEMLM